MQSMHAFCVLRHAADDADAGERGMSAGDPDSHREGDCQPLGI